MRPHHEQNLRKLLIHMDVILDKIIREADFHRQLVNDLKAAGFPDKCCIYGGSEYHYQFDPSVVAVSDIKGGKKKRGRPKKAKKPKGERVFNKALATTLDFLYKKYLPFMRKNVLPVIAEIVPILKPIAVAMKKAEPGIQHATDKIVDKLEEVIVGEEGAKEAQKTTEQIAQKIQEAFVGKGMQIIEDAVDDILERHYKTVGTPHRRHHERDYRIGHWL